MTKITDLIKAIRQEKNLKETLDLLVGFANGVDYRYTNASYVWLQKHIKKNRGQNVRPSSKEWRELCQIIREEGYKSPVDSSTSLSALKTLMEYEHNKQKAVDNDAIKTMPKVKPLTSREIARFKTKFDLKC